jgi:ketosteroid isomerase-like protein
MSRKNVEVVRQAVEANHSDDLAAAIDTHLALSDPDIEFRSVLTAVEVEVYRGHNGVRSYFSDLAASWQEWRNHLEETIDVEPGTVVATIRFNAIGKDSSAAVETHLTVVFALSEGKFLRVHTYRTRAEALEAVGLTYP